MDTALPPDPNHIRAHLDGRLRDLVGKLDENAAQLPPALLETFNEAITLYEEQFGPQPRIPFESLFDGVARDVILYFRSGLHPNSREISLLQRSPWKLDLCAISKHFGYESSHSRRFLQELNKLAKMTTFDIALPLLQSARTHRTTINTSRGFEELRGQNRSRAWAPSDVLCVIKRWASTVNTKSRSNGGAKRKRDASDNPGPQPHQQPSPRTRSKEGATGALNLNGHDLANECDNGGASQLPSPATSVGSSRNEAVNGTHEEPASLKQSNSDANDRASIATCKISHAPRIRLEEEDEALRSPTYSLITEYDDDVEQGRNSPRRLSTIQEESPMQMDLDVGFDDDDDDDDHGDFLGDQYGEVNEQDPGGWGQCRGPEKGEGQKGNHGANIIHDVDDMNVDHIGPVFRSKSQDQESHRPGMDLSSIWFPADIGKRKASGWPNPILKADTTDAYISAEFRPDPNNVKVTLDTRLKSPVLLTKSINLPHTPIEKPSILRVIPLQNSEGMPHVTNNGVDEERVVRGELFPQRDGHAGTQSEYAQKDSGSFLLSVKSNISTKNSTAVATKSQSHLHSFDLTGADYESETFDHAAILLDDVNKIVTCLEPTKWLTGLAMSGIMWMFQQKSYHINIGGDSYLRSESTIRSPRHTHTWSLGPEIEHILICMSHGQHWTLVKADIRSGEVNHYDSLDRTTYMRDARSKFTKYVEWLAQMNPHLQDKVWKFDSKPCQMQRDSDNCGIYTLVNAMYIMSGQPVSSKINCNLWREMLKAALGTTETPSSNSIQRGDLGMEANTVSIRKLHPPSRSFDCFHSQPAQIPLGPTTSLIDVLESERKRRRAFAKSLDSHMAALTSHVIRLRDQQTVFGEMSGVVSFFLTQAEQDSEQLSHKHGSDAQDLETVLQAARLLQTRGIVPQFNIHVTEAQSKVRKSLKLVTENVHRIQQLKSCSEFVISAMAADNSGDNGGKSTWSLASAEQELKIGNDAVRALQTCDKGFVLEEGGEKKVTSL